MTREFPHDGRPEEPPDTGTAAVSIRPGGTGGGRRPGDLALAAVAAALLVFSGGDVNTLVPLFAIGVFVGFTVPNQCA